MVVLYTIAEVYVLPVRANLAIAVPVVLAAFVTVYLGYQRARGRNRKAQADEMERGR